MSTPTRAVPVGAGAEPARPAPTATRDPAAAPRALRDRRASPLGSLGLLVDLLLANHTTGERDLGPGDGGQRIRGRRC